MSNVVHYDDLKTANARARRRRLEREARGERSSQAPAPFSARRALRYAGVRVDRSAGVAARGGFSGLRAIGAEYEPGARGAGDLFVWALATVLGLAFLDAMLSGRGPSAVSSVLGLAGDGISKLFSPHDPLLGASSATTAPATAPGTSVPSSSSSSPAPVHGETHGVRLVRLPPDVTKDGAVQVNAPYSSEVAAIARRFHVKVSSGYRSASHNAEVGGAPNSDHLSGNAVDFVGSPAAIGALYRWASGRFPYVEPMSQAKDHVHISFARGGN